MGGGIGAPPASSVLPLVRLLRSEGDGRDVAVSVSLLGGGDSGDAAAAAWEVLNVRASRLRIDDRRRASRGGGGCGGGGDGFGGVALVVLAPRVPAMFLSRTRALRPHTKSQR